jgi:hypothetical protein
MTTWFTLKTTPRAASGITPKDAATLLAIPREMELEPVRTV